MLQKLSESVVSYNIDLARRSLDVALELGIPPDVIITDGLAAGMSEVGRRFDEGKFYLPQVVAAAKIVTDCLVRLRPLMTPGMLVSKGCIIMGSVHGDIHEIGKNVCSAMLRGAGYEVIDLGADVTSERFTKAAAEHDAIIIGASALMTTTLTSQKNLVKYINEIGATQLVVVGGAPCSQEWCDEIGATGYSSSGPEIVKLVDRIVKSLL